MAVRKKFFSFIGSHIESISTSDVIFEIFYNNKKKNSSNDHFHTFAFNIILQLIIS
jgi:hypothetical protein